jgi:RHS repeat-associated protein
LAYRFHFNGKETDNEVYGEGNALDFGSRIYNPRLGRWLAIDPKGYKYPGYSPYHFGYDNPIITIDPNGEENIVVVGNQGASPSSDTKQRSNKNQRHFLEAGLNEALRLKNESTQNDEITTLVIFQGTDPALHPFTDKEIEYYIEKAAKAGIKVVVINSDEQLEKYVNKGRDGKRKDDLITDFSYIGHGDPDNLLIGHDEYEEGLIGMASGALNDFLNSFDLSEFNKGAFDKSCNISLNACGSGLGDVFDNALELTTGKVTGANTTMIWGVNGLGTSAPFNKVYVPFLDQAGRNDPRRSILPAKNRIRTENGNRK